VSELVLLGDHSMMEWDHIPPSGEPWRDVERGTLSLWVFSDNADAPADLLTSLHFSYN